MTRWFSFSNVAAGLALVIAIGTGGAYAASTLSKNSVGPRQIKNDSLKGKEIKADSLTGLDIQESSLALSAGPQGPTGPQGPAGPEGPVPTVLPSGKSLQGTWAAGSQATGNSNATLAAISFPYPLESNPTAQLVPPGGPATAQCPGTASAPTATAGFLCVYISDRANNNGTPAFCSPTGGGCNATTARKTGTVVEVFSAAAGLYYAYGTWAVTAP